MLKGFFYNNLDPRPLDVSYSVVVKSFVYFSWPHSSPWFCSIMRVLCKRAFLSCRDCPRVRVEGHECRLGQAVASICWAAVGSPRLCHRQHLKWYWRTGAARAPGTSGTRPSVPSWGGKRRTGVWRYRGIPRVVGRASFVLHVELLLTGNLHVSACV